GGLISCNLFDVIRPGPPVVGRYLAPDECQIPAQTAVAVLSETVWRARFNADSGVIGRVIHLNRIPVTVVGLAPGFTLPVQLYIAESIPPAAAGLTRNLPVNARHFHEWRTHCRSCEDVALFQGVSLTLVGAGEPVRLPA